jgi:hypothetical protein
MAVHECGATLPPLPSPHGPHLAYLARQASNAYVYTCVYAASPLPFVLPQQADTLTYIRLCLPAHLAQLHNTLACLHTTVT